MEATPPVSSRVVRMGTCWVAVVEEMATEPAVTKDQEQQLGVI